MSNRIPCHRALHTVLFILLTFAVVGAMRAATKDPWDSVSPEDLAAKDSKTRPGADAEILLSFSDFNWGAGKTYINRIVITKIYTQKGVEDRGRLGIEIGPWERATGLVARVLKQDGRVLTLKKSDYLESTLFKYDDQKWKKIAFAFPDLTPGDVVEFRWTAEVYGLYSYRWDFCQQLLPVKKYEYKVTSFPTAFQVSWFNCMGDLKPNSGSSVTFTLHDLPAFEPEEFMPPEREYRGWISTARDYMNHSADDIWKIISSYEDENFKLDTRSGQWKGKAVALIAGAATDDEKLRRLYDYCQREIVNYDWSDAPEAKAAKEKSNAQEDDKDKTRTGSKALSSRLASSVEINLAFATLARAAGFEVKQTQSVSRAELLDIKTPKGWAFLDRARVAVKMAGKWRVFDPGNFWAPYGMLGWTDEMATVLLCDDDKILYEQTPVALARESPVERKARFVLDDEGALQGDVEESFAGHAGMELKVADWDKTQEDIDKKFAEDLVQRLATAEVSEIHWENLRTRDYPVVVRYKVRIPGYAEQAGSRLTFAPEYFEAGRPAIFTAPKREFAIFFPYAHLERDDIEIKLPDGFQLDHPGAPTKVGDINSTFGAEYNIQFYAKKKVLHYTRTFVLGGNGVISFPTAAYPAIQQIFTHLHRSDTHSLIIRPGEQTTASAGGRDKSASPDAAKPANP